MSESAIPKLRVLLSNDDGPPGRDSPYIFGLYKHLTKDLGWDVRVVIPSSQKSWIGKAYHIAEITRGRYYYPRDPDGKGEVSETSRPLKDGELAEWILLDGTPATCANIGLHNLYPGEIDLLLSGPNLGRNSSAAFALSSGTIGAALSSSLSKTRSIALSYGTVARPVPLTYYDPAHELSARIVRHLWAHWGADEGGIRNGEVDLYSVNVPMIAGLLAEQSLGICWTHMWRNSYGRLFAPYTAPVAGPSPAGPDAPADSGTGKVTETDAAEDADVPALTFKFAPDMTGLINPTLSNLPVGSDGWAIEKGLVSVTPMRACFAEPVHDSLVLASKDVDQLMWKVKL